ncbi:MAG: uL15 family ribosomal protein [Nitrososphaerota archaeon]|nr:uL15 family ribosomal protein [Nitrososphaerota archaeon]MDG7024325.1 uL15 family ribosomal protein [Nitrososphaerota archaeon]
MPTRARKGRRYRGMRTHGYGQIGQHRHSGKQGGHGNAGLHKHKWSWLILNDPDHFGRDPFRPPGHVRPSRWMNVGQLDGMARGQKSLDLSLLGVGKLLGAGEVSGAYQVKVDSFTKKAQAKIEAAGGKILVQE